MFFKIWNSVLFCSVLSRPVPFHSILFYSCFKLFWFHSRVQFCDASIRVKTFNGIMCPICTNGLVVLYDTTRAKEEHMGLNTSHLWQAKFIIFLRKLLSMGHKFKHALERYQTHLPQHWMVTMYYLLVFWVSHFIFTFVQIHSTAVRIAKYLFQQEAFWPMQLRCSSGTCRPKLLLQTICTICLFKDRNLNR